ncbi:MAG: 4Fe-4S binding protein [Lentisphaeria bacterium]|nr:4Fe-4S binding protein [Lentisphaeria bacterium]
MLNAQIIKEKARELGAVATGIGDVELFKGVDPRRDPKMILPNAKCVIGFLFRVPRALYRTMEEGKQFMQYTQLGVKYIDEDLAEIFLFKIGSMIENAGYDACLQRNISNLRIKGDHSTNPEVVDTYELAHAEAVSPNKPAPEIIMDFNFAAKVCGLGAVGDSGHLIAPGVGPFLRMAFIVTDAPLECDAPFPESLCDHCGKCKEVCPGKAIDDDGVDSWQCAVYYRGAHGTNPFMEKDFLMDDPEKEAILSGNKRFDRQSAREIYKKINFLPSKTTGYIPCICGKACDMACYRHLKEKGVL